MRTKKQRKITMVQINAAEKKMQVLRRRQQQTVKRTTPLKIQLRKYIQQNMEEIQTYLAATKLGSAPTCLKDSCHTLRWAVGQVRYSYFGDANLKDMLEIIEQLRKADLLH